MKITDLQVDGFGVWNDLTVDSLSREMTVFFGRNEAGKTTLMQFIRSTLYGYTPERRKRYLPPVFGGVGGGSLYVHNGDLRLQIQRHARPESDVLEGDLAVLSSQGHQYGHDYLARLLASVDEAIFNNVFALGLHEIQELASLDGTEAARELYKLASGVDRVSLIDVMGELEDRRGELLDGRVSHESARAAASEARHGLGHANDQEVQRETLGRMVQLHRRRKEIQRRIDASLHQGRNWVSLIDRRRELEARLKQSKDELSGFEAQARILELANLAEPTVRKIRNLEKELEVLAKLPDERDVDLEKLARLDRRLQDLDRRIEQIAGEADGVKRSAERLPLDRSLWKQATRIEAVAEHRPWIESIERQMERNRGEIRELEAELVEAGGSKKAEGSLDRTALAGLAGPGRAIKSRRRDVELAKRDLASAEQEVTRLRSQLDDAMASNSCESLGDSFHEAGKIVHLLRRRQEIDGRIDRLQQQRKVAEAELDESIQSQVFSPERLFVVGGFVVIGVALILFGWSPFLVRWLSPNPLLGFLGCGVVLAGMGLKKYWEYESQDQVDRAKQSFDSVRDELSKLKSEREELDRTLPQGFGRADGRLDDAQHRLSVIERLLPMEGRISEAAQQRDAAQERLAQAEREQANAERRWKQALQALGVSPDLNPTQVRQLAERGSQFERTRQRLADARRQLAQFEEDRAALMRRIEEIALDSGLKSESKDPLLVLQRLETELRTQRGLMERRREFAQQYQELREKRALVLRRQHRLKLFRTTMFSKVGAASDADFRGLAVMHRVRRERRSELDSLQGKIKLQLGEQIDATRVLDTISRHDAKQLERDWESLQKKIEELRSEQEKSHETRGELTQQIKQLADSDELERAKLEAAEIDRQLMEATHDWQELTATTRVLESLREFYETHRQPDTLRAASEHLGRMTGGRYTRLWTRMVGNQLLVDGREGSGLSVDVLSRGTREAVFLSLRLALVEIYRKRGIRLPMVLDDVLVNFDAERARWAGEVLRDFAQQGHQVLMFTCHAHVSQLFQDLGCDVRVLPYHRDVVHRAATVVTQADDHLIVEQLQTAPPVVEVEPIEAIERIERTIDEELRPPRKKKKRRRPAPAGVTAPEPPMPTRERQRHDSQDLWWQDEE